MYSAQKSGSFGRNQNRGDKGGGDAEARQRRPVQQRRGERAERHQPEQDERGRGHEKTVQRIGGVDGRERHGGSGGGEDRGNVGDRQRFDRRDAFLAAGPFAGGKQRQRERAAEQGAHAGSEQSGLDRIADHEEAAERQRQAADPDHPAGADAFFEAGAGLRQRRGRRRRAADRRRPARRSDRPRAGATGSASSIAAGCSAATSGAATAGACSSSSCGGSGGGRCGLACNRASLPIASSRARSTRSLIERLARDNQRDKGHHQRKKIEHQASRRSARCRGLPH